MPNNVPLDVFELAIPIISFVHEGVRVSRPITDHLPMVQNTLWGAVATLNSLNPGSPIAPSLQKNNVQALPGDGAEQMKALAEYIYNMFVHGVGLLALQEVPNPNTKNFESLVIRLTSLVGDSDLIDVDALKKQWLKTGMHSFGTSIFYNPGQFVITQNARPTLSARVAEYRLMHRLSSVELPIANIHGDFKAQPATQDYIDSYVGICLGDTNLYELNTPDDSGILQSAEKCVVMIDGTPCHMNTFDMIRDAYSRTFQPEFIPDTSGLQ